MGKILTEGLAKYVENQAEIIRLEQLIADLAKDNDVELVEKNVKVAEILGDIQVDTDIIAVALLRDLELSAEIKAELTPELIKLLQYADKMKDISQIDTKENNYEDYRNVLVIMAKDYRIIILELATRLYKMRLDKKLEYSEKAEFAKETLYIYCPIAHRLGLGSLKTELEELSLYFIDHETFMKIAKELELKKTEREALLGTMVEELREIVKPCTKNLTMFGRSKSIYSIYNKTYAKGKKIDDIYDLQAIRIICDDPIECYTILGVIHDKYQPIPGRFKDYIALKKPNLYQSLHTTIVGINNQVFEIQIRTYEMDEIAERGIAAHWLYKEKSNNNQNINDVEEQLHLFRDVIMDSAILDEEQMENLQNNIFESSIYTLTPNGKIINLPKHATVIDFAYRIHSRVAEQMNGAIVNGKIAAYNYELKNGDIVKIRTKKNFNAPNLEWLEYAKTTHARRKIRAFLKKKRENELKDDIERGRELLYAAFKKEQIDVDYLKDDLNRKKVIGNYSLKRASDLFYEIGMKRIEVSDVVNFITQKKDVKIKTNTLKLVDEKSAVIVKGASGIARQMAKCCHPVLGDEIVGVVVNGVGIKIHRTDCPNITNNPKLNTIDVKWNNQVQTAVYHTELQVLAEDRDNLLQEVILILNKQDVGIENFASRVHGENVKMTLNLVVKSNEDINRVIENIKKIRSIIAIERVIK